MQPLWRRQSRSGYRQSCRNEADCGGTSAQWILDNASIRLCARCNQFVMKRISILITGASVAAAFAFFFIAEKRPVPDFGHVATGAMPTAEVMTSSKSKSNGVSSSRAPAPAVAAARVAAPATVLPESQPQPGSLLIPVAGIKANQLS